VYSLLVRLTQDRALAEDLSQETFIRLARGAPTLAPDTRLGPWLLTVARNLAMDHFRWRRMHLALTNDHSIGSAFPRPASPFASAVTSQASRHVEAALAKLKPDERELLLRVSLDGCTPNELALDLGLSAEVVRKRLSRARGRLLELLEQS